MNHFDPYRNAKDLASILSLLEYETQWLIKSHTANNIDDIDGFALQIIAKCLKSLRTLSVICTSCEDYPSANSILRMVIDSIAVYNIVYANLDIEERRYWHYLYIKDSIATRLSLMEEKIENTGGISEEEFAELQKQYEDTAASDRLVLHHCDEILSKHSYSSLYPEFHRQSLVNSNWRYREKVYKSNVNKNRYSWEDIYVSLDSRKDIYTFISSHLSQFVHGLCVSNIAIDETTKNSAAILSFGIVAAGKLRDFLKLICPDETPIFAEYFKQYLQG